MRIGGVGLAGTCAVDNDNDFGFFGTTAAVNVHIFAAILELSQAVIAQACSTNGGALSGY